MQNSKVSVPQLGIWVVTATTGPVLFYANGNWYLLLPVALVLSAISWLSVCYGKHWDGSVYRFVQLVWIGVILSQFLSYSAACWPTGERTFPVVPLTLLALAAISVSKGIRATVDGICVVFWISLFLIGIVFVAGFQDVEFTNFVATEGGISANLMLVLLLPAAARFVFRDRCSLVPFAGIGVLAVVVSLWIAGTLGTAIAEQLSWPFYEAAKSAQLFNVAKRFESLVSVGVTLCNYCLYCLLLSACVGVAEKILDRKFALVLVVTLSACFLLLEISINSTFLLLFSLLFWVVLPLLGTLNKKEKEL